MSGWTIYLITVALAAIPVFRAMLRFFLDDMQFNGYMDGVDTVMTLLLSGGATLFIVWVWPAVALVGLYKRRAARTGLDGERINYNAVKRLAGRTAEEKAEEREEKARLREEDVRRLERRVQELEHELEIA